MLRSFALIAAATTTLTFAFPAVAKPEIGKPAPDFAAKDIDGKEQKLSAYKGKIVVLEWNNPECPFVKKHYDSGNMQGLQHYAKGKGVVWLAVNSGAPGKQGNMDNAKAHEVLKERKSEVTAYIPDPDGTIGHLYDAKTTPHMFVVDKNGDLAYAGAIDDKPGVKQEEINGAKNYVKEAVDALAAGNPVKTASTTAYGCQVKYE